MKQKVILAAGGTGGHIYPAIAVADVLKKSNLDILFWGATQGLENKIVPQANYSLTTVKMGRLNSNVRKSERLLTLFLLPLAFLKAIYILLMNRPLFVLGFGGHASAPLLLASSFLNIPSYIWEPNALPGLANRKLSQFVDEAFVVFEAAKKKMKCPSQDFGLPIRKDVENTAFVEKPISSSFNVLIYGGSQGSRAINNLITEIVKNGLLSSDVQLKLQTGVKNFQEVKSLGLDHPQLEIVEYLHDMPSEYAWADLTIARAGTGTISELASVGMPSLLIPLPTSADNHQYVNAHSLVEKGASILLEEKNLTAAVLWEQILSLKKNKESLLRLSQNIKSFYKPQAAENIAAYLLKKHNS